MLPTAASTPRPPGQRAPAREPRIIPPLITLDIYDLTSYADSIRLPLSIYNALQDPNAFILQEPTANCSPALPPRDPREAAIDHFQETFPCDATVTAYNALDASATRYRAYIANNGRRTLEQKGQPFPNRITVCIDPEDLTLLVPFLSRPRSMSHLRLASRFMPEHQRTAMHRALQTIAEAFPAPPSDPR